MHIARKLVIALQCIAVHCRLQCAATHCIMLQCTATHRKELQQTWSCEADTPERTATHSIAEECKSLSTSSVCARLLAHVAHVLVCEHI